MALKEVKNATPTMRLEGEKLGPVTTTTIPLGLDCVEPRTRRGGARCGGPTQYRTTCLEGLGRADPIEAAIWWSMARRGMGLRVSD